MQGLRKGLSAAFTLGAVAVGCDGRPRPSHAEGTPLAANAGRSAGGATNEAVGGGGTTTSGALGGARRECERRCDCGERG